MQKLDEALMLRKEPDEWLSDGSGEVPKNTQMRVLMLAPANNVHTQNWANLLVTYGVDVHVASLHMSDSAQRYYDSRVRLHALTPKAPFGYLAAVFSLRQLIKRVQPTLLNTHYATGYGTLARLACPKALPYLLSVWGTDVYEFPFKSALHRWQLTRNLARATRIASTSRAMARHTQSLCSGSKFSTQSILLTPFPVNTELFKPSTDVSSTDADAPSVSPVFRVGTVKGLEHRYGIDRLLRLFAAARQNQILPARSELVIAGEGADEAMLKQLAVELGIATQTKFLGRVEHADVAPLLRSFDVYVALSRFESFGVALLEASACGIPVITSNAEGPAEVVQHGQTGFVCSTREQALGALRRLVINPLLRQQMGQAGRHHVMAHYSQDHCARQMLNAYTATIEASSHTSTVAHLPTSSDTPTALRERVVVVLSYPLTEPVIRNRFLPLLQEVASRYSVVLVAPPQVLHSKQSEILLKQPPVALPEGVEHVAVPVLPVQGVNFVTRAWREWVNAKRLHRQLGKILCNKTDATHVLVSLPSMFLLFMLPATLASKGKVKTLTVDIRDLTWEYLSTRGVIGVVKAAFQERAKRKLRLADIVTTTNQEELAYVQRCRPNAPRASHVWMTNGISQAQFTQLKALPTKSPHAQASCIAQPHIMYIGNIGHAEHLQTLLEVAQLRPAWQFTLIGQGSSLAELKALTAKQSLTNVSFPGRCEWSTVLKYYQQADVLFAQVHPSHQQQVPSKLYEYAATGRPVVFAGQGYALQVLRQFKHVFVAEPLNAKHIAETIETALKVVQEVSTEPQIDMQARAHNLNLLERDFIRERGIARWLDSIT